MRWSIAHYCVEPRLQEVHWRLQCMNYACPAHSLVPQQNDRVCEVALESFLHEVTAVKCLIFSGIEAALTPASRVRGCKSTARSWECFIWKYCYVGGQLCSLITCSSQKVGWRMGAAVPASEVTAWGPFNLPSAAEERQCVSELSPSLFKGTIWNRCYTEIGRWFNTSGESKIFL